MTIEITNTGGVVNIRDTSTPLKIDQLDFTAAANTFSLIVDRVNDVVQIRHSPTNRILCAEVLANFATPSAGDIDALVVALNGLLFDSTALAMANTLDYGIVYVSPDGSDTNPGSMSRPLATFAQAASVASGLTTDTGSDWCIHILSGEYNEAMRGNGTATTTFYHLHCGAVVAFSRTGAAVSDTNGPVSIYMEAGSVIESLAGNTVTSTDAPIAIYGKGTITCGTASAATIDAVGPTASITIDGPYIQNNTGINCGLANIAGGNTVLRRCRLDSDAATTPIMKSGGQLLLNGCEIVCAATYYADTPGMEEIQVNACISNKPSTVDITEVGGTTIILSSLI